MTTTPRKIIGYSGDGPNGLEYDDTECPDCGETDRIDGGTGCPNCGHVFPEPRPQANCSTH